MLWPFRSVDNLLLRGNVEGCHGMLFTSNYLLLAGEGSSKYLGLFIYISGRVCIGFVPGCHSAHQVVMNPLGLFPLTYWAF